MRTLLLTIAVLALAACGQEHPDSATGPVEPAPIPSKPPLVQPPEVPTRMAFVDASGVERLRLSCGAASPSLRISVPGFNRIGSEDRLTLGAGDEAFAYVADLEASEPGVVGGGPVDAGLMDRLARGEPVHAVYGAQTAGPLRPADPETVPAFAERCRGFVVP